MAKRCKVQRGMGTRMGKGADVGAPIANTSTHGQRGACPHACLLNLSYLHETSIFDRPLCSLAPVLLSRTWRLASRSHKHLRACSIVFESTPLYSPPKPSWPHTALGFDWPLCLHLCCCHADGGWLPGSPSAAAHL